MSARRYHACRAASTIVLAALALFGQHRAHAQHVMLTPKRSLDFGSFVVVGSAGTVTLLPNGERRSTGGVILLNSSPSQAASLNARRNNNGRDKGAHLILPPNGNVRLSSGANSMTLTTFTSNPAAPGMASLPNGNGIDLSIGATLVVAPQQPAGVYRGSFPVTVNLN